MKKSILAAALLCALSSASMAQTGYASVGLGASNIDVDCGGAAVCDRSGTSLKLVAGLQADNGFAMELGYMAFGKARLEDPGVTGDLKAAGPTLGAAYRYQATPSFGLTARAGAIQMRTRVGASVVGFPSTSDQETTTRLYYGVAVDYALTKSLKAELSADFARATFQGESFDLRAVNAGLRTDF